jgi:MOSC domain-containing protein YiiM
MGGGRYQRYPRPVRIVAVYSGRAAPFETPSGTIRSAIAKTPVDGPVAVGALGLDGDEQVSPGHGGPDRALCVYPSEHHGYWGAGLPQPPFGENLSTEGVLEAETLIGETWRIGSVLVEVSQPRSPCHKVAARLGRPGLVAEARRTGFVGLHLRVLAPGMLAAGDPIERLERPDHGVTVADAVRARFERRPRLIAAAPELAADWRAKTAA